MSVSSLSSSLFILFCLSFISLPLVIEAICGISRHGTTYDFSSVPIRSVDASHTSDLNTYFVSVCSSVGALCPGVASSSVCLKQPASAPGSGEFSIGQVSPSWSFINDDPAKGAQLKILGTSTYGMPCPMTTSYIQLACDQLPANDTMHITQYGDWPVDFQTCVWYFRINSAAVCQNRTGAAQGGRGRERGSGQVV